MVFLRLILLLFILPGFPGNLSELSIQARAKEQRKNIAVYFSGSDWCASCHKFKKNVIDRPKVDSVLSAAFIYYNADFPQRKSLADSVKRINEALAEKLNPNGIFPALVITTADLKIRKIISSGENDISVLKLLQENKRAE